jgi:hypothetical protein
LLPLIAIDAAAISRFSPLPGGAALSLRPPPPRRRFQIRHFDASSFSSLSLFILRYAFADFIFAFAEVSLSAFGRMTAELSPPLSASLARHCAFAIADYFFRHFATLFHFHELLSTLLADAGCRLPPGIVFRQRSALFSTLLPLFMKALRRDIIILPLIIIASFETHFLR